MALDLRRRDLLTAAAALPLLGSAAPTARRFVVVVCSGGWDPIYSIDPKPGVEGYTRPSPVDRDNPDDVESVETINGIQVSINNGRRPAVAEFFERYGARTCGVNGIWVGGVSHMTNIRKMLTGTRLEGHSDLATIASTVLAPSHPVGHADLIGIAPAGPLSSRLVRIGMNGQLRSLIADGPPFLVPGFTPDAAQTSAIAEFRASRIERLRALRGGTAPADLTLDTVLEASEARPGLDALAPSLDVALRSGTPETFAFPLALTAELFRTDLCRVVTLASPVSWDSHVGNNAVQSDNLQELFGGLLGLMDELALDGLLDTTTIAIISEMNRTPLLNATNGKDHWPGVSTMLIGGDVRGGRVIGATTDSAEPVEYQGAIQDYSNLGAGILQILGVDPEAWLPGVVPLELG
jgi:hypothetical protein